MLLAKLSFSFFFISAMIFMRFDVSSVLPLRNSSLEFLCSRGGMFGWLLEFPVLDNLSYMFAKLFSPSFWLWVYVACDDDGIDDKPDVGGREEVSMIVCESDEFSSLMAL